MHKYINRLIPPAGANCKLTVAINFSHFLWPLSGADNSNSVYWVFLYITKKSRWQQWEQTILLSIPLVSTLIRGSCLSQIFQTLAITQQAGLPLSAGLDAAARSIHNYNYQQALRCIQNKLAKVYRCIPLLISTLYFLPFVSSSLGLVKNQAHRMCCWKS